MKEHLVVTFWWSKRHQWKDKIPGTRFWESVKNQGRQSSKVYCQGAAVDVVIRVWGSKKDRRVLWLTEIWLAAMAMEICYWEWKTKEKRTLPKHNRNRKRGWGGEGREWEEEIKCLIRFPSRLIFLVCSHTSYHGTPWKQPSGLSAG